MYEITNEIPAPPYCCTDGKGRKAKYPFSLMEIGDSFAFKAEELDKIRAASAHQGKRNGKKYTVSGSDLRCWRIL